MDVSREEDADQLRRIATMQQQEIEGQTRVIARMGAELDRLRGNTGATQEALDLLEQLRVRKSRATVAKKKGKSKCSKKHSRSGPTPRPELLIVEKVYELDAPDQVCTSCGGELVIFEGQFEESEMIDVVEVN